jgi:hypothetical protein
MLYGTASHLAECPDLGPECKSPTPPTPFYHHVALFMTDAGLDASYGIVPWLAAELHLTLRIVDTTPTYSERDGTSKLVPNDIHHHDETIVGPSDPWLVLRFAGATGKLTTAARLGVSLPVGSTQPDPYKLGAEGKPHEHTQLGTGTFMPIIGLGLSYPIEPVQLSASALALFSIDENSKGYRAPSRYFFSVRASLPLVSGKLIPYVAAELPHETQELWNGSPGLEGSNVRTELLLGGGLAWEFLPAWQVELGVRARAVRFTTAAAFDYPGLLQFGLSTHFDLQGKAKEEPR